MAEYIGNVDYIQLDGTVVGWVIDVHRPDEVLEVEVVSKDGTVVANALSDLSRQDVAEAGAGRENCGFRMKVDPTSLNTDGFRIRVVAKTHEFSSQGAIKCCVDTANRARLAGWALAPGSGEPVTIDLIVGGKTLASKKADLPRSDVLEAGHERSDCGFEFDLKGARLTGKGVAVLAFESEGRTFGRRIVDYADSAASGNIDRHSGRLIIGWLENLDFEGPSDVEVLVNDRVVLKNEASIYREDLVQLGQERARCGFHLVLPSQCDLREGDVVRVREALSKEEINGSPFLYEADRLTEAYLGSFKKSGDVIDRFRRRKHFMRSHPRITIVMPVFDTPEDWLEQAIDSVRDQWSPNWELVCVDDCSRDPRIGAVLSRYAKDEHRIRVLRTERNSGIAAATNLGIANASSDVVMFMDHDDVLEPNAVYQFGRAFTNGDLDLCYSDEIVTSDDISVFQSLRARPAFSYDYYLSHPYFVHAVAFRKSLTEKAGLLDEGMSISADVDFVLRILEVARYVGHIALPLYRWRTHATSVGHAKKAAVTSATVGALTRSLERVSPGCTVAPGFNFNEYKVSWPRQAGKCLVVVPSKNNHDLLRQTIESIRATVDPASIRLVVVDHDSTEERVVAYLSRMSAAGEIVERYTGPFNFSRMNNVAVSKYKEGCDTVLFLNDDVEAQEPGWLERLLSLASRPDVGAVAPLLLFPDTRIQHAGVIVGFNGLAEHVQKFTSPLHNGTRTSGFNAILTSCREYSAVTAACLVVGIEKFLGVGGFDEALSNAFNDVDLCLRLQREGLKILYDGQTALLHHESATRAKIPGMLKHPADTERFLNKWQDLVDSGDPFYSPLFGLEGEDHVPAEACLHRGSPDVVLRPVRLGAHRSGTAGLRDGPRPAGKALLTPAPPAAASPP